MRAIAVLVLLTGCAHFGGCGPNPTARKAVLTYLVTTCRGSDFVEQDFSEMAGKHCEEFGKSEPGIGIAEADCLVLVRRARLLLGLGAPGSWECRGGTSFLPSAKICTGL